MPGAGEVLRPFLKLGLTSFGGAIAHLGYFRNALVLRRRWLSEAAYADLVALCQFLPGPASSQVGFALGFVRGGLAGALLETRLVEPGWVTADAFLAGYGATQAVPGPLFTFAAYLGAIVEPGPDGIPGAAIALLGIFPPGMLLMMGVLPFWDRLRHHHGARDGMAGTTPRWSEFSAQLYISLRTANKSCRRRRPVRLDVRLRAS